MIIRRKVLVLYLWLTAAAVVALLNPKLWAIPSLLSLGLLSFVPMVWIYSTLLLPVLILRPNKGWILFGKAASVGLAALVAVGVPVFLNNAADRAIARATAGDFKRKPSAHPRHFNFVSTATTGRVERNDPLTTSRCDKLCQRLLLNKAVRTVTMVYEERAEARSSVQFRIEKRARCPEAFADSDDVIVDTVLNAIRGNCIVAEAGAKMNDGFVVRSDSIYLAESALNLGILPSKATRHLIWEKTGEALTPILRRTSIEYSRSGALFIPSHYYGFLTSVAGWRVAGEKASVNGACAANASLAVSCFATLRASEGSTPRLI